MKLSQRSKITEWKPVSTAILATARNQAAALSLQGWSFVFCLIRTFKSRVHRFLFYVAHYCFLSFHRYTTHKVMCAANNQRKFSGLLLTLEFRVTHDTISLSALRLTASQTITCNFTAVYFREVGGSFKMYVIRRVNEWKLKPGKVSKGTSRVCVDGEGSRNGRNLFKSPLDVVLEYFTH